MLDYPVLLWMMAFAGCLMGSCQMKAKQQQKLGIALCTAKSVSDLLLCPLRDYADASILDLILPGDIEQHGCKAFH
jgi:hypothetical protein